MKAPLWVRIMLSVFVIVGLVLPPVTAPAKGSAMADKMSCCPHKQPAVPDCQKTCPLMALCMAKCFADIPTLSALTHSVLVDGDLLALASEQFPPSHASAPPARPPRP
jgi:hypothetical protein